MTISHQTVEKPDIDDSLINAKPRLMTLTKKELTLKMGLLNNQQYVMDKAICHRHNRIGKSGEV